MKETRRKSGKRGAATVEAILALGLFIIVWAGVLHMGRMYHSKLELKAQTRACAWKESVNSCSVEVECASAINGGSNEEAEEGLLQHVVGEGAVGEFLKGVIEPQIRKLFGERATVSASKEVPRPARLGGEQVTVNASYSLPCNTKPVSTDTLAGQLLELVKEKVF